MVLRTLLSARDIPASLFLTCVAVFLPFSAGIVAESQQAAQYFQAIPEGGNLYYQQLYLPHNCPDGGPLSLSSSPSYSSGPYDLVHPFTLPQSVLLIRHDDKWQPTTVKTVSVTSDGDGTSTYVTSVSSSGEVTTVENGMDNSQMDPFANYNEETVTSTETIDLNTGQYTFEKMDSFTAGSCIATLRFSLAGVESILFVPMAALPLPMISFENPALTFTTAAQESQVPSAPAATALAADGASAVAVVYQSQFPDPVTFTLTAPGYSGTGSIGGMTTYSSNYLNSPQSGTSSVQVDGPINESECSQAEGPPSNNPPCIFLALLWGPPNFALNQSTTGPPSAIDLSVQAVQNSASGSSEGTASASISLLPPPLILVHGVWSNATAAWAPFLQWIPQSYPHNYIYAADYGAAASGTGSSNYAFSDSVPQQVLATAIANALQDASNRGFAAQTVDVFAHSMGGLVTRYFMDNGAPVPFSPGYLPPNPIHSLVTVGTPQNGSPFAAFLEKHQDDSPKVIPPPYGTICSLTNLLTSSCSLKQILAWEDKPIGPAIASLVAGYPEPISRSQQYRSIVGTAPDPSVTGTLLDAALDAFSPVNTVDSILGTPNDTIVPGANQDVWSATDTATIAGIVHTSLIPPWASALLSTASLGVIPEDIGETASQEVWDQVVNWLLGIGAGQSPATEFLRKKGAERLVRTPFMDASSSTAPAPVFDLSGYSQVDSSNVSFSPESGSILTIGTSTDILATSTTKIISEVLLFQNVTDPSDASVLYNTQSPFAIPFTPLHLGSATFIAYAVFTDNTFSAVPLSYPLQPSGNALALLLNAPTANLPVGLTETVQVQALFANGLIDVTQQAAYIAQSGGASVFSVDGGGAITTTGNGTDWLNVSFGGQIASAQITVGACSYALSPTNQSVDAGGGMVMIQVTAPSGCAWTANVQNSPWLSFATASGTGSGAVTIDVSPNTTGTSQSAIITVANQDVAITQQGTMCSYTLGQTQIDAPATGASGSISIITSCTVVASSSASWVSVVPLNGSVAYNIVPNTSPSPRSATITIGDQTVSVSEAAATPNQTTPVVAVIPSSSSVTTAQALSVTITVNGGTGNPTPTGLVTLSSGTYTSGAIALAGGSAAIGIPAGSLSTGTDTLTASYTPDSASSSVYNSASSSATVTVTIPANATPTVTVTPTSSNIAATQALSVTVTVTGNSGNPTPTGSVMLSGGGYTSGTIALNGGSAVINIPADSLSTGTDTLTVSYTPDSASSSTYTLASGNTTVIVTNPTYSMTATALTVTPGAPGNSTITVGSTNGYAGTIMLACAITSSPAGAVDPPTCSANQPVTLSSSMTSGTGTVVVNTTASSSSAFVSPKLGNGKRWGRAEGVPIVALLILIGIPAQRRKWRSMLGVLALVMIMGTLTSCGSGGTKPPANPGTTPGAYTITVTGTGNDSAKTTTTTTFTLTVN